MKSPKNPNKNPSQTTQKINTTPTLNHIRETRKNTPYHKIGHDTIHDAVVRVC